MIRFLKGLFARPRVRWRPSFPDPVLGEWVSSEEDEGWEAAVVVDGRRVIFEVSGGSEPDASLVTRAHEIARDFSTFHRTVDEFLVAEAIHYPGLAGEIRQLVLESICLFWSQRPGDGMFYFKGPDSHRWWRCDYVAGQPRQLGFDD